MLIYKKNYKYVKNAIDTYNFLYIYSIIYIIYISVY